MLSVYLRLPVNCDEELKFQRCEKEHEPEDQAWLDWIFPRVVVQRCVHGHRTSKSFQDR